MFDLIPIAEAKPAGGAALGQVALMFGDELIEVKNG
jgi:hypothetical protein